MAQEWLLRGVQVLEAPDREARQADVSLRDGRITALDGPPIGAAPALEVREIDARGWWLAPPLVDPHSVLEEPWQGRAETLNTLAEAAACGGYGTVALLPRARTWRDRADRLTLNWEPPLRLHLWGSFSVDGRDEVLAPHADQIAAGAIGLAAGDGLPPLAMLERGLRLGEMGGHPVLLAPRDGTLALDGVARERVEALRAGWSLDPVSSETLPLQIILEISSSLPSRSVRLMNLSTAEAVAMLRDRPGAPLASVSWWHLLADSGLLDPAEEGWRVRPPLGSPRDREALISALLEGVMDAVSVHHVALDPEEQLLPVDQRKPGLAGHGLVLPLLWAELVGRRGWSPRDLWRVLCWGPSRFLDQPEETLELNSRRWLLFDPDALWTWGPLSCPSQAANQPCWNRSVQGKVVAAGFIDPGRWSLGVGRLR